MLTLTLTCFKESIRMLLLQGFLCLLVVSKIEAFAPTSSSEDVYSTQQMSSESKKLWKFMFAAYYEFNGLRNKTTDDIIEAFFEHEFKAYPEELYPAFEKIFQHISKSNDRIWNLYESILYLYHNVDASDRIYETALRRFSSGKLLTESGELDLDALFSSDELSKSEFASIQHRSGAVSNEDLDCNSKRPSNGDLDGQDLRVGSIRAIPGVHFPDYDDIPITSFTCADRHIPGFYADLETGCQVFHVCYPHRRESFLCPVGTIFNQALLACDYWYSSNCSLAPLYFIKDPKILDGYLKEDKESLVDHLLEQHEALDTTSTAFQQSVDTSLTEDKGSFAHFLEQYDARNTTSTGSQQSLDLPEMKVKEPKEESKLKSPKIKISLPNIDWTLMIKFLPIKSTITEFPDISETTTYASPMEYVETTSRPLDLTKQNVPTLKASDGSFLKLPTLSVKKDKHEEKAKKSEILLDIVKAVKSLTKEAEDVFSKMQQNFPAKKPAVVTPKEPGLAAEINPRFVVKPAKFGRRLVLPKVYPSKSLKPSKQIIKPELHKSSLRRHFF